MRISDWSSDVCSSDLRAAPAPDRPPDAPPPWSRRRSNRGPPRRRRSSLEGSRSFFLLKCVQPGCDVGHLVVDETAIQIGRAHVRTPVTNEHIVCRLLLVKKQNIKIKTP